ncbi:MAG: hypothetical protein M1828_004457 [Chrysothrix sp. TS-e1954]|nr:MAG: hypothetical protein M1828_004457 [Chrysothrix sp. TS-e1954]
MVVSDSDLNHGITLSHDGSTLYASSPEAVFAWPYDAMSARTTGDSMTIVNNMTTSDHTTRTLLLSKKANGTLVITRGSTSNIDPQAEDLNTGHSQIKSFDISNVKRPYDFNADGKLLGWGVRNDVGIDEEPTGGGLYSVENSVDQLTREDKDIHQNNPGEKMNFLGYLNGTQSPNQGGNFGYPSCFAAWDAQAVPNFNGQTGMQFAIGTPNATNNDTTCQNEKIAPRLVFQAHMAPLTILFNDKGTEGWVTFHGSWDRTDPVGYKVSVVQFADGSPVEPSTSNTALQDIVTNPDNSQCPGKCFRPAGLAWDSSGRLFFTSDASGEVYVITSKANNGSVNDAMPSASQSISSQTSSSSGASGTSAGSSNSLGSSGQVAKAWGAVGLATLVAALLLI